MIARGVFWTHVNVIAYQSVGPRGRRRLRPPAPKDGNALLVVRAITGRETTGSMLGKRRRRCQWATGMPGGGKIC